MGRRTARLSTLAPVIAALAVVALLALALGAAIPRATAQANVTTTELVRQTVDTLPAAPASVALSRLTLTAGASATVHPAGALTALVVEGGTVTIPSGVGQVQAAAATAGAATPSAVTPGATTTLTAGDEVVIPTAAAADVALHNIGGDAALLLVGQVAAQSAVPTAGQGVAVAPLSVGVATALPPTPVRVTLNRVTYPAGAAIAASAHPGPTLVWVESGTLGLPLQGGQLDVTHATTAGTPTAGAATPAMATPGTEPMLHAGDAAFIHAGTVSAAENPGSSPATILVFALAPA